jgi:hypothetical protein
MQHFIYTRIEGRSSRTSSGTPYTVTIYKLIKGTPKIIATSTDCFMSEFQQVMYALENAKALPRAAFEKYPTGGNKYGAAWLLRDAGFANINRV